MKKYKSPYEDMFKKPKDKPKKEPKPKTIRTRFEITIDTVADADVIEELAKHPNKSEYVRKLIRQDMRERGK